MSGAFLERIVVDPAVMVGKPVVKGTRIPVELVLKRLSQDLDVHSLLSAYPRLTHEDIRACVAYAEVLGVPDHGQTVAGTQREAIRRPGRGR